MSMEHPTVSRLRDLQSRRFEQFRTHPPGPGWGVIYVGVAVENGKCYVGKHAHGKKGECVGTARWAKHQRGSGRCWAIQAACRTHSVHWFVIDRVPEDLLDERERYWMTEFEGVESGYNLREGGQTGAMSEESIERLKLSMAEPDSKLHRSTIASEQRYTETRIHPEREAERLRKWRETTSSIEHQVEMAAKVRATWDARIEATRPDLSPEDTVRFDQSRKRRKERRQLKKKGESTLKEEFSAHRLETAILIREARKTSMSEEEQAAFDRNCQNQDRHRERKKNGGKATPEERLTKLHETIDKRRASKLATLTGKAAIRFKKQCEASDRRYRGVV